MMYKFGKFVTGHPVIVVLAIFTVTCLFGLSCLRLRFESDIKKLLPSGSRSVIAFNEIDEKFGGADELFIAVERDNIFNYKTLSKIRAMGAKLQDIPGVSKVFSITDMDEIKPSPDGIEISPILGEIPKDPKRLLKFKNKLLSDNKYSGRFLSLDGGATLIVVKLYVERADDTVKKVKDACRAFESPERIYLTGSPYVSQKIMEDMRKDLFMIIPLAFILIGSILFLSFWTWWGVALPLLTVTISAIWSMGMMALFDKPITAVTSAVPVLLFGVGSAYGIHIIERFKEESKKAPIDEALPQAIGHTGLAIFIAAGTTMVGFASNAISDISAIAVFGLVAAFGTFAAFVVSVSLVPALLKLLNRKHGGTDTKSDTSVLNRPLDWWSSVIVSKRSFSILLGLAFFLIAVSAFPRIKIESDPLLYFDQKSEVVRVANLVRDKFGGAITLDILFKGDLKDPIVLAKMDRLQQRLRKVKLLGTPYSIIDVLKDTNFYMNEGRPEFRVLPKTREGIAQYLLLLSVSGSDFLQNMITSDNASAVISCRVGSSRSKLIGEMLETVKKDVSDVFGEDPALVKIELSGMSVVIQDMRDMLIINQFQSLALAVFFVFLMVFVFYRSFIGAVFCMVPLLLTVALTFGFMGWFNIALDMATVMVASISIGLGIDYSVHLFNRYEEERAKGSSPEEAIRITISNVGKAVIYNALSVGLGFLLLLLSQFKMLRDFGILSAFAIIFSAFGALAILPEFLSRRFGMARFADGKKGGWFFGI